MSNEIVNFKPKLMSEMTSIERQDQLLGKYASMDQQMEAHGIPACPSAAENRVNSDFHSSSWTAILGRVARMAGLEDMIIERERKEWNQDKSKGFYYNSEYFAKLAPLISKLVAIKARNSRAPITSGDISNEELEDIIEQAGLVPIK